MAEQFTDPRHRRIETPLGTMVIGAAQRAGRSVVTGCWFDGQAHFPAAAALGRVDDGDPALQAASDQLEEYFAGQRTDFELPLALPSDSMLLGHRVWRLLQETPSGETTTYGAMAAQLGQPRMAQAVGQAVGRNPWSVVVPCHRVLSVSGDLTGYAGGIERKRALLELEKALPGTLL